MTIVIALVALVLVARTWRARRPRREVVLHELEVERSLPDTIDMLRLGAHAGLTPTQVLREATTTAPAVLAVPFSEVLRRVDLGARLGDALDALAELGEPAEPLVAILRSSAFDGTPMAAALERAATDARLLRRRRAEEGARRLPVRLLLPLIVCILPAFAALTVVPLAVTALGSLNLDGGPTPALSVGTEPPSSAHPTHERTRS